MQPLAGRIDLWCTFLGAVDEALLPRYRAMLSAPERLRAARFHFDRDRRRDLVTRALVRTVLSRYGAREPQEWRFSADVHGRPRIDNPLPGLELQFNLSHAAQMIVLAVSERAVGVDVETIGREGDIERLERYFSPAERAALRSLPAPARRRRFFELWTLKESYLKARGVGLRLPLDAFGFEFAGERGLRLSFGPRLADSPRRWRFWQLAPREDYVVSVCAPRRAGTRLSVREAVPLAWEREREAGVSRSTDAAARA